MSLKLFTIGDSISQGFMSLAAARTDLSYSTVVAEAMGWSNGYEYPLWDKGGHPINLEDLFRKLNKRIGDKWEAWNPIELVRILDSVFDFMDEVEDFYERGNGRYDMDYGTANNSNYFHNVAVRGFKVADAWTVSYDLSRQRIEKDKGTGVNDKHGLPSASFFRTAARVLSRKPVTKPEFNHFTAIDWLKYHTDNGGIENVFLWLGANNVLGTVVDMHIGQSTGKLDLLPKIAPTEQGDARKGMYAQYELLDKNNYTIWHINDFKKDYETLMAHTDAALGAADTKVFVGTVPYVTILPIARGMGKEFDHDGRRYFEYYTYFPFDSENLADNPNLPVLKLSEVLFIENTIREYNKVIVDLVAQYNSMLGKERYHIVDLSTTMEELAFRRNYGVPKYNMPEYIKNRYPVPDTRYYERHPKQGSKGGLFSLDGVHPTAIGQAIIGYEFMKAMQKAGVPNIPTSGTSSLPQLNWEDIYSKDMLYTHPIYLVADLYKHDKMKEFIVNISKYLKS